MSIKRLFQWGKYLALSGCLLGMGASASANNVQVLLEGSLVKVLGDNFGNQIIVAQNAAGDVIVTGRNGTLVNGLPSVRLRRVNLEQMEIRMEGGNDIVTVNGLRVTNDLYVNLGAGNDRLLAGAVPTSIGANLAVEGGSGNELIRLTSWVFGGDCYVDGQTGSLNATFTGLEIDYGLTVIGDSANDIVTVTDCFVGDSTSLETKAGADRITVTEFTGFDLFVSSDLGNDTIILDGVATLEDVGVYTGGQNDSVTMVDVAAGKNIKVSMDIGTDVFMGTNVTAVYDAVFEGGDGSDTFGDFGVSGGTKTEIKEFEIFP